MKDFLLLYRSKYNDYYNIENHTISLLQYLRTYYFSDYRYYDESLFIKDQSHYQETIIVNNLKNKELYLFPQEYDIENHIPDDDRPGLTNEWNSCKIGYDNFIEFREKWMQLKADLPSFALIYREDNDWVDCKGFETQEEMETFVRNAKNEVI